MNDNELRQECKELKVFQGITYKEIAELLEIKYNSFYSWINKYYDFSEERKVKLQLLIDTLKE